jgi:hypothetical protein
VSAPSAAPLTAAATAATARPVLEPGVSEVVLAGAAGAPVAVYAPRLLATARLHYVKGTALDTWATVTLLAPVPDDAAAVDWNAALASASEPALAAGAASGASFTPLPGGAARAKTYRAYQEALVDWLRRARPGGSRSRTCDGGVRNGSSSLPSRR